MTININYKYTEEQYKKYCDFCLLIANGTIIQGLEIHYAIEEWKVKENLSEYTIEQMDKRMEKECEEKMRRESREHLTLIK